MKTITEVYMSGGKHTRHFLFPLKDYRHIISYNAFFFGKNRYNRSRDFLYLPFNDEVYQLAQLGNPYAIDTLNILTSNPEIQCVDLYDFYSMIGFNRKTKKYHETI